MTLKNKTTWFKVDDVTSVTKEEENDRQQRQRVTVGDEMILAQAMKPIPQANQRSEQEQTTPVC